MKEAVARDSERAKALLQRVKEDEARKYKNQEYQVILRDGEKHTIQANSYESHERLVTFVEQTRYETKKSFEYKPSPVASFPASDIARILRLDKGDDSPEMGA